MIDPERPVSQTGMNLNVQIDRVVLDGLNLGYLDRTRLNQAMRAELTQLLAADGLAAALLAGGAQPRLPAGSISAQADADPELLGRQIAQAVYKGIGR